MAEKKKNGHYLTGKEIRAIAKENSKVMKSLEKKKYRKVPESAYLTEMKNNDNILEIEDQLRNDVDRAIIELLFIGVAGKNMEDIYAVSAECVRGDLLIVNGKTFPITDRLKEILPKAFAETEFEKYRILQDRLYESDFDRFVSLEEKATNENN